jgi:hypothetical protein
MQERQGGVALGGDSVISNTDATANVSHSITTQAVST